LGFADVYLIEARSIGGLSGCPVFVRPTLNLSMGEPKPRPGIKNFFGVGHGATLLGLMHGHWEIRESDLNKVFITHVGQHGVNLGIGIVVPAYKILDIINRPELQQMRQEVTDKLTRSSVPGMDSAKPKKEEPRFTKEDFETALKKASRKISDTK